MVWRDFGLEPEEYDGLPGLYQDIIAEGIAEEYSDEDADPGYDPDEEASLDDLAGLGVNVRSVG